MVIHKSGREVLVSSLQYSSHEHKVPIGMREQIQMVKGTKQMRTNDTLDMSARTNAKTKQFAQILGMQSCEGFYSIGYHYFTKALTSAVLLLLDLPKCVGVCVREKYMGRGILSRSREPFQVSKSE